MYFWYVLLNIYLLTYLLTYLLSLFSLKRPPWANKGHSFVLFKPVSERRMRSCLRPCLSEILAVLGGNWWHSTAMSESCRAIVSQYWLCSLQSRLACWASTRRVWYQLQLIPHCSSKHAHRVPAHVTPSYRVPTSLNSRLLRPEYTLMPVTHKHITSLSFTFLFL